MFDTVMKNNRPLADQAAEHIMQLIRDNSLNVGDKLPNEFELAERLGVGRGTVRESIKLLVSRNILEVRRGKGTFVSQNPGMSEDPLGLAFLKDQKRLVLDLMEVRLLLEPAIVSMAAQRATPEDMAEMNDICDKIEERMSRGENYVDLDMELHTCFARSTQNQVIPQFIPVITQSVSINIEVTNRAMWRETQRDHREVVSAISQRDTQRASAAMVRHLISSNYDIVPSIYVDTRFAGIDKE